jgi:hypothetical protein
MYLNETYSKIYIGKNLSDAFTTQNGLKQGDASSPLLVNFALECAFRKVQENQKDLKLMEQINFWFYTYDVTMLSKRKNTIEENTKSLLEVSGEVDLEVNTEDMEYMVVAHHQNAGQYHN